jgi:hypothetical protein
MMPRLTAELIAEAPQFTNPVKDWELDLRGEFSSICLVGEWISNRSVCAPFLEAVQ